MAKGTTGNNGNGDGELKALWTITWVEKSLPTGGTIGMREAGSHMTGAVIPGGSLSLDLALMARLGVARRVSVYGSSKERELLASCPTCKTFETLWFKGDVLTPTKRFAQGLNKRVYHDCGSHKPCRLFPKFVGEWSVTTKSENLPPYLIETSRPGAETTMCVAH